MHNYQFNRLLGGPIMKIMYEVRTLLKEPILKNFTGEEEQ